jgi:hypothetical protein
MARETAPAAAAAPRDRFAADPLTYDGPRRIDGRLPYNGYLWPTWCRALNREGAERWMQNLPFDYRLDVVELDDGRFSTDGTVYGIQRNLDCYGQRCVYATREEAIRTSAGRMLRRIRRVMRDRASMDHWIMQRVGPDVIQWVRQVAHEETGAVVRAPIQAKPMPRPKTGLPLFDL